MIIKSSLVWAALMVSSLENKKHIGLLNALHITDKYIESTNGFACVADCVYYGVPQNVWPKTVESLSKGNLNTIIDDAMWLGTPAEIAAAILKSGYVKGGDK